MSFQNFVKIAKRNRQKTLAPYKERFFKSKTRRDKFDILKEVVQLEPSHLREPWVANGIAALMEHPKFHLDTGKLLKKGKEHSRFVKLRNALIYSRVQDLIKNEEYPVTIACRVLADKILWPPKPQKKREEWMGWDLTDQDIQLEEKIRQAYYRHKEELKKLPRPYYGRDIDISD
jgi:hypothetical protein